MTTPSLEPTLAAYLAGFFDGEGYVTIHVPADRNTADLYVGVGSTDMGLLELLRRTFGGCLTRIRVSSRLSRRPSREWKATNEGAAEALRAMYPYLRVKKRQAALAFKFRKVMAQSLRSKDAHRLDLLRQLAAEVRGLNRGQISGVETVKEAPRP